LNTGWLTSGPKVIELEGEIKKTTGAQEVVCVNSWTSGAMLMLKWLGVGTGDEVIIPAYTYSATALCALNLGAKVIMVDVKEDFTLDPTKLEAVISEHTKAVIPVDLGGWPADFDGILEVLNKKEVKSKFRPQSSNQIKMGRVMIISDAAHSIGGIYHNKPVGSYSDATVLSFHSVKNVTTGEGGAVCLNLPANFDPQHEYKYLKALALNGQTKSAFEKNQPGAWRYDIIAQGLKINMPDICAAIGLAQIRRYKESLLPERVTLFQRYLDNFKEDSRFVLPVLRDEMGSVSSAHLFLLRLTDITESERDAVIQIISEKGVGVNVHYIPMPMLTLFKELGFRMIDYPETYRLYSGEISLPIYNGLGLDKVDYVCKVVQESVNQIKGR
jgi:dTDP-4-amino-4,6-dideoxygalactose transaminase